MQHMNNLDQKRGICIMNHKTGKKIIEYGEETPQSHTADQHMPSRVRVTKHYVCLA